MKKDYSETRLLLDSDDKDSANRTQSSLLVIAEVQPVLVFEDKVIVLFTQIQENKQIFLQLHATTTPKSDKCHFSPKNLSQLFVFARLANEKGLEKTKKSLSLHRKE